MTLVTVLLQNDSAGLVWNDPDKVARRLALLRSVAQIRDMREQSQTFATLRQMVNGGQAFMQKAVLNLPPHEKRHTSVCLGLASALASIAI